MISAFILDIENRYKGYLPELISTHCKHIDVRGVYHTRKGIKAAIEKKSPDVVFFDTYLPRGKKFDIPKEISGIPFIVLVTASSRVAVDAIRTNVFDCLLKPLSPEDLTRVEERLLAAVEEHNQQQEEEWRSKKIAVNDSSGIILIDIPSIVFLEAQGNYTNIYVSEDDDENVICVSKTLKHFEKELPESIFYRVHKSYIINVDRLSAYKSLSDDHLIMDSGHEVDVSRRRLKAFREFLAEKVV
ncbi:MAG: response regulator transcription factor [Chitinophagales bacterium]|nr:response regulator transcription factor [Chitinophagales bacterium]